MRSAPSGRRPSYRLSELDRTPPPAVVEHRERVARAKAQKNGAQDLEHRVVRPRSRGLRWLLFASVVAIFGWLTSEHPLPAVAARIVQASIRVLPDLDVAGSTHAVDPSGAVAAGWAYAPAADPIRRGGYASIPGGVLFTPASFRPEGDYDLLLHFHGNTRIVRQSAEIAELNAAVAVINLGVGSAPYEQFYAEPGTYEKLLASIDRALKRRGVEPGAKLRRVALSSWSAGYGSISTILQVRRGDDPLDALLLLDGLHCGWEGGVLNPRQMRPFVRAAERAARGETLFLITHSEIDPKRYASAQDTARYLLGHVGGTPQASDATYPKLWLSTAVGAVARSRDRSMVPTQDGRVGELIVRGFEGETPEHHMSHLFQMAATAFPPLVERWSD